MKVFSVNVKNYKSLKSFNLELDGKNLVVAGPTGSGKTTAISTLWDIIEKVGEPVTHGERKGFISLTLVAGNKKVFARREFTEKTNAITILTSEGEKVSAAQFKSWIHAQSVDPHKILSLGPLEQTRVLLSTVTLPAGIDLAVLAHKKEVVEVRRKDISSKKKAFGVPVPVEQVEELPLADLQKQLEDINADIETRAELMRSINGKIIARSTAAERLGYLKSEATVLEEQIARLDTAISVARISRDEIPELSAADISAKLSAASIQNKAAMAYQDYIEEVKTIEGFDSELATLSASLEAIEETKRDALEKAVWPMPGLSIQDESIYLNNILLENCGTSERMLVAAVLVGHAVAKSPVKIVRMDGIESMSAADFTKLLSVYSELGVQVLASKVVDEQSDSISIEESADVAFDVQLL